MLVQCNDCALKTLVQPSKQLNNMKRTKVQTLGTGHALAKHLVGSEDRYYVEELNLCVNEKKKNELL